MTVTIYHNPRCSKSRATLALLEDRGIEPVVVEYLTDPPDAAELKRILGLLGKRPRDIVRPKEAREAGIDLDAADAARMGRPPESVLEILKD